MSNLFTVINDRNKDRYTVSSYNLKVLKCNLPDLTTIDSGVVHQGFKNFDDIEAAEKQKENRLEQPQVIEEEVAVGETLEPVVNESHDELIESLLKKADDFSSKYLKAQMDLEALAEESAAKEETIRAEAFKEGQESAMQEAASKADALQASVMSQLQTSIETLDHNSKDFSKALQSVKEELVAAALEIAKEVIVKELDENSKQIALNLATLLMKDIDNKSDIILRVHPNQVTTFNNALSGENRIKVVPDMAVSEGGVVVLSQMGTIEADIMQRFEHIKRNTLS